VDFSPYSVQAARIGVDLSRRFGSRLRIFHAVCTPSSQVYGNPVSERGRSQEKQVRHATEAIQRLMSGLDHPWTPLVAFGDPVEALLEAADRTRADLVIAVGYGMRGIQRLLHGTVVERMIRTQAATFLVIPAQGASFSEAGRLQVSRIIAACDTGGGLSERVLGHALAYADLFGARLDLLHAMESPGNGDLPDDHPVGHYAETESAMMERRRRQILDRIPGEVQSRLDVSILLRSGVPGEALVESARYRGADLIIVGVRSRHFWGRVFKGSTTESVLRHAPCLVFAVPERTGGKDRHG
jgi:nucleotide-binding universal stress UspA family protein